MRIIFTLSALILCLNAGFSQCLKYSDLQTAKKKPEGKFTWYISKSGEVFTVGDKITIGQPSNRMFFSYIIFGDGLTGEVEKADASISMKNFAGRSIEIKHINVVGGKNIGYSVQITWDNFISKVTIDLENALASGEVVSSIMTSDQALSELKKAKDKLDLGIITQVEYDSIKTKLVPFIK